MPEGLNGNVPDLGAVARAAASKPKAAVGLQAIVRHLDEDGTYEPELVRAPNGHLVAVPPRAQVLDGEQLASLVLEGVRKELRAFAVRMGHPEWGPVEAAGE